jgi:epoxyqueuosine reductase
MYHGFMSSLEARLKERARELGFQLAGIAPATEADGFESFQRWLTAGYEGEMTYMSRHAEARRHPRSILASVQSVIMVGMNYYQGDDKSALQDSASKTTSLGRVARYARGADYHDILRERLLQLLQWLQIEKPGCRGRAIVDTAPLLERDFARRAGLGWFGKNTMLLNPRLGSYFFLGALLLDIALNSDAPFTMNHCGTCTACLDACPTQAFESQAVLDSRRCISYLTIELKGPIPGELRDALGDWVYGCDVCQEVCPWNRKAPITEEAAFRAQPESLDLVELLTVSEAEFRRRYRDTPLWRAKRRGLLRNAALILAKTRDDAALAALRQAATDHDAVVRDAALWALEHLGGGASSTRPSPHAEPSSQSSVSR